MKVDQLTPASFHRHPIWEYATDDETADDGELAVRPVSESTMSNTSNRLFGLDVHLADGVSVPAMLSNVDPLDPTGTRHFLTVSVWTGERWFHLARYHDITYEQAGPSALAAALGRPLAEVFPIDYDLTPLVNGNLAALRGRIVADPVERLSRADLIARAVRSR